MWVGWEEKDDLWNPVFLTATSSLMNLHCKRSWITREVFIHFCSFQSGHMAWLNLFNPQGDGWFEDSTCPNLWSLQSNLVLIIFFFSECRSGLNKWDGALEVGRDTMELLLDAVKRYDFIISKRLIINFLLYWWHHVRKYIPLYMGGVCGLFFFNTRVKSSHVSTPSGRPVVCRETTLSPARNGVASHRCCRCSGIKQPDSSIGVKR